MENNSLEKELETILSSVERIISSDKKNIEPELELEPGKIDEKTAAIVQQFGEVHDQSQMYALFYQGIQKMQSEYLPKDATITEVIRNLSATILSKKMKKQVTYGVRGGDSRQASVSDYRNLIDAYSEWVKSNPNNLLGLAHTLLQKGKDLGIIPPEYEINDFVPAEKK